VERRLVLDLRDQRPVWAMPDWVPGEIRSALGSGWRVVDIQGTTDGSGDGRARTSAEVLEAIESAEVYFGYGVPEDLLKRGQDLAWVHSGAAGVGGSLTPTMRARDVLFTNSAGIHAPPIAETVLGMMLYFARGLDFARSAQAHKAWDKEPFYRENTPVRELGQSVVGIIGYGGVGRAIARRVRPLGARVLAMRRRTAEQEDEGIRIVSGPKGLGTLLDESDFVVVAAPSTPETRGMIDRDALDRLKPHAVLINVARGSLVDEEALAEKLGEKRIRGVGLDVFAVEPLPESSPLWHFDNVILTPHVSGVTTGFWRREVDLIVDNIGRYLRGRPLRNLVDKQAGY
jgi:phosphoglycerate dehydrogenase-like enzyme